MEIASLWEMFTTTLGSAAVIAIISALFFASPKRKELHKNNKNLHRIIVAIVFGLLSIYASASAVPVDGLLCNCRNLAPLFAGMTSGPIAGLTSALIGGLFRYFVYGGVSAVPCMLACFLAGIFGSIAHLAIKKENRYKLTTGLCMSIITEGCHMLLLVAFGMSTTAFKVVIPVMIPNILGLAFPLYMYNKLDKDITKTVE